MQRKYFEAYAIMDSKHLRSNAFHHSCIIFLYANCDENGNITSPFYITDSYSFYSHPLPYKKSFQEEPLTFFTQKIDPHFRFRGSFGEWKRENIHDLTLGKGLTGRLFEKNASQIETDKDYIETMLKKQHEFLSKADNLVDQEEMYRSIQRQEFLKLVKNGTNPDEAHKKAETAKPLPEFNSFPLDGKAYTCKTATLSLIASSYNNQDPDQKIILNYIDYLRYGSLNDNRLFMFPRFITSFIPRLTPGLDELVLHCSSTKWEARGEKSKYPYCDWKNIKEDEVFAVVAGGWYVDLKGCMQPLLSPDNECKNTIANLKALCRICEINLSESNFEKWHEKLNHYILKIATCSNTRQQHIWSVAANEYLRRLASSKDFTNDIKTKIPENLKPLFSTIQQPEKLKLAIS